MYRVTTNGRGAQPDKGYRPSPSGSGTSQNFAKDERGNVAITFGLMIFIMIGFIGASVDVGRWLLARKQTQEAIDSAVLAGLRKYQEASNETDAINTAQTNYNYSVTKSGRGVLGQNPLLDSDNISFVLQSSTSGMTMAAVGVVKIKMPFIGLATQAYSGGTGKIATMPLLKTDGSENAISKLALGSNTGTNLEVSVMIDITGSMTASDNSGSTKIQTVKTAAANMVDILVWADQSQYTSKMAIVPFSEAVNLGSASIANAARGNLLSGTSTVIGSLLYKVGTKIYPAHATCVTERLGSNAYTDLSPLASPVGIFYSSQGQTTGSCPTATPVMPLTSDKTALKATITSLTANGGTAGQMGTAWAWYMLSPNFNSLWPSASQAAPYSDLTALNSKGLPKLRKIAVLMTDGDYNADYCNGIQYHNSGNTYSVPSGCSWNGDSDDQAQALCTAMKAKGIEVFTIGSQVSAAAKTFLQKCATDTAHFYDATDGNKMQQAFMDIAYKLVPPYISH